MRANQAVWLRRGDQVLDKKTKATLHILSIETRHHWEIGKKTYERAVILECVDKFNVYCIKHHFEVI